jgi:hypothetical protein
MALDTTEYCEAWYSAVLKLVVGVGAGALGGGEIGSTPPPPPVPQADSAKARTTAHALVARNLFVIGHSAQAVENARLPG